MRTLLFMGLVGVLITCHHSSAVEPQVPTTNPLPKNEHGEPKLGPVRSAKKLLGATVKKGDNEFGRIEDIALDIGQGTVSSVFIMPQRRANESTDSVSIPWTMLGFPKDGSAPALGSAIETYRAPKAEPNPSDETLVVLLSALEEHPVHNARGVRLGQVVDFVLATQSGQIGYAVVTLDDDPANKMFPIPLTAFVVPQGAKAWVLDLPGDVVSNTPAFRESEWPEAISRAWTEYVHVRYGRSHIGGVERQLEANGNCRRMP